ncbi:hypothetical protein FF098_005045 [Parvularcula flava]|uniref:Uncharacterized protein n=1 Tax=Aquisalinus luteolus TaxID=1566827 RepID=A0A8J3A629_9PROT|nr:hypothetical protein [Aquisalinus luteolus]NHK27263.1 hypothetical protein [Aquisalinus luteolus]GGH94905.1 hypothetical protein GCM10011355_10190 [Aquisalinus luteolus]
MDHALTDLLFKDAVTWSLFFWLLNWGWAVTAISTGVAIWYTRKPHVGWGRGWQFIAWSLLPIFGWFLFAVLGALYFEQGATPLGQWLLISLFILCVFSGLFYSAAYFTLRRFGGKGAIN